MELKIDEGDIMEKIWMFLLMFIFVKFFNKFMLLRWNDL